MSRAPATRVAPRDLPIANDRDRRRCSRNQFMTSLPRVERGLARAAPRIRAVPSDTLVLVERLQPPRADRVAARSAAQRRFYVREACRLHQDRLCLSLAGGAASRVRLRRNRSDTDTLR